MSPVGAITVPFPPKTGKKLSHPRPLPIVERLVEAPGQMRFSSKGLQITAVDGFTHANGSSELVIIFLLQAVVGMRPDTTSQVTALREIVTLPMR